MMTNKYRMMMLGLLWCATTAPAGLWKSGTVAPAGLTCEYLENPLGIDAAKPRLGWKIEEKSASFAKATAAMVVSLLRQGYGAHGSQKQKKRRSEVRDQKE